jgi:hypothetical protein
VPRDGVRSRQDGGRARTSRRKRLKNANRLAGYDHIFGERRAVAGDQLTGKAIIVGAWLCPVYAGAHPGPGGADPQKYVAGNAFTTPKKKAGANAGLAIT